MNTITLGSVSLPASDVEAVCDAWERIDAAADRGEECEPRRWNSHSGVNAVTLVVGVEMVVDANGDLWHDGLFLAHRDGDFAIVCGSGARVRVLA